MPSVVNTTLGTLRMLMNVKIMFDHYYCVNATEMKEIKNTLYLIASSHLHMHKSFLFNARTGRCSVTHNKHLFCVW